MPAQPDAPTGAAPPPPSRLPDAIPIHPVEAGEVLYRIHRSIHDPIFFGPGEGKPPTYRFDSARGLFGVLYVGLSLEGAFVETVLRNPQRRIVNWQEIATRSSSQLTASRTLRMAKMFGDGLAKLGTDNAISAAPYEPCWLWADALWDHHDRVDGIAYRSRFDNNQICLAIFEREQTIFSKSPQQELASMREIAGLLDRYGKSVVGMDR